ncbi:MAG: hypothetical protein IKB38_10500 [Clostridia bacterium]|nr:hypothetical protein [Clostridia bacterium]
MKKIVRITLLAVCLLALTLSFVACGEDESGEGAVLGNGTESSTGSPSSGNTDGENGTGSQGGSGTGTESGKGDGNEGGAGTEEHVHAFGEWETLLEPTCTEEGKKSRKCSCGVSASLAIDPLGHDEVQHAGQTPTCSDIGWYSYVTCSRCDYTTYEELEMTDHKALAPAKEIIKEETCEEDGSYALIKLCEYCGKELSREEVVIPAAHSYEGKTCERCGDVQLYVREGNKILFGTYPQTRITDFPIINALYNKAGGEPKSENSGDWISYGYYIRGIAADYMWYIDIEHEGELYRGVFFSSYRPFLPDPPSHVSEKSSTYQDDSKYTKNAIYWFRHDPISWTVLSEENGVAFILCDMIIDAQEFDYKNGSYLNNYAESTIRAWLNETFMNTAFSELEQAIIETTLVDNSAASSEDPNNPYACENTYDKIFLASFAEVTNSGYGFSEAYTHDAARKKKMSEYARSQGAYGWWWLRSPYDKEYYARQVSDTGFINKIGDGVHFNHVGIVPALRIRL